MKNYTRFISILLTFALFVTCMPVNEAKAATTIKIETTNNTKIYQSPVENAAVKGTCKKGSVLTCVETVKPVSSKFTLSSLFSKRAKSTQSIAYYKVSYETDNECVYGYIVAADAKIHTHNNRKIVTDIGTYYVCEKCGEVSVQTVKNASAKDASLAMMVLASAKQIGPELYAAAALDGPLPYGDIIAGTIVAVVVLKTVAASSISTTGVTSLSFVNDLKSKVSCSSKDVYYPVDRVNKKLVAHGDMCMSLGEAYVYMALGNGNIYTEKQSDAKALAMVFNKKDVYCEKDRNKPTYFYHYHIKNLDGQKIENENHIFFGTNKAYKGPEGLNVPEVPTVPIGCSN